MRDEMKEEFKAAAKAAGNLAKTGFNALADNAENKRQMTVINNQNLQAAALKTGAMVNITLPISRQQWEYAGATGLITLDANQEKTVLSHGILSIKQNGGPANDALIHEVLKEQYINSIRAYIDLRSRLGSKWIFPECPQVKNGPSDGIVLNSCLELRYKATVAISLQNDLIQRLDTRWNTDKDVINIQKEYGLHTYQIHFDKGLLVIRFQ